jgi:NAD(P)-dependent dehydrogenase (short-subunit alcohol dehydrogenase family)
MVDSLGGPLGPDAFLVTGRVAIVTGAARGIGRAVALALARFGADVAICDREAAELEQVAEGIRSAGRRAVTGVFDVRDADAVGTFVGEVVEALGQIDVLVNNAGGGFRRVFDEVSAKGEDALIRENFTSVTAFVRAVLPHMPAPAASREGGGSIIMITSIEAHRAGPEFAVYSAMKAGVASLTKSLALELGARHVRVNAVAPDVIPTPGTGPMPVHTPLPYAGHADDVAAAVVYLASPASGFVTGTTVHVDGGNLAAGGWVRTADGSFVTTLPLG